MHLFMSCVVITCYHVLYLCSWTYRLCCVLYKLTSAHIWKVVCVLVTCSHCAGVAVTIKYHCNQGSHPVLFVKFICCFVCWSFSILLCLWKRSCRLEKTIHTDNCFLLCCSYKSEHGWNHIYGIGSVSLLVNLGNTCSVQCCLYAI